MKVKVGDLVKKIYSWDDSRDSELGTNGIIVDIEQTYSVRQGGAVIHVQWNSGKIYKHSTWELVVINERTVPKKAAL